MDKDHSWAAPGPARFEATRWSVVLEAAQSQAPGSRQALAELCRQYWPPLSAFARQRATGPRMPKTWSRVFLNASSAAMA